MYPISIDSLISTGVYNKSGETLKFIIRGNGSRTLCTLDHSAGLTINDLNGIPATFTHFRFLQDSTNTNSVDWNSRTLSNPGGQTVLNWNSSYLIANDTAAAMNWSNRVNYDSLGNIVLDWNNKYLIDTSTIPSVDWNNRYVLDVASGVSLDWGNRVLLNSTGQVSINYNSHLLIGYNNDISLDYAQRYLFNSAFAPVIGWEDRSLSGNWNTDTIPTQNSHLVNRGTLTGASGVLAGLVISKMVTGANIRITGGFDTNFYVDLTGLDFNVGLNEIWAVNTYLTLSGQANGFKFRSTGPVFSGGFIRHTLDGTTTSSSSYIEETITGTNIASTQNYASSATIHTLNIVSSIANGNFNTGFYRPQLSVTAIAAAKTGECLYGSYMIARRIR